ncbi:sodium-coupled monocarboxylate transporter 2-like [Schistocerca piceifrons]|uniref:sodium-coupled monocarboxylate transporter 2-like n=1 Tax=Schistocerca piceifrons TaxID=274613 RepID=UPI001F5F40EA|nr:sodium-coupled monocarboxylate transporter 2-like [Schistocerca piceifrons]
MFPAFSANLTRPEGVAAEFGWVDYLLFALTLVISALIGVYFAFFDPKRQNTRDGYLMGGRTMGIFPISMSLIASYISGISLLAIPAEMYVYGTQYWVAVTSDILASLTMAFIYLPVFYQLKIVSSYEYLELRFSRPVRLFGSVVFLIKMMLYIPIVIYVPALAFSQVTGFNLHLVTPVVCIVCIFYTMLGGLKAVVWTDALQTVLMFGGVTVVMILGTVYVGGPAAVWQRAIDGERIEFFKLSLDPTERHTIWSVVIGNYTSVLAAFAVNQAMVQRALAMSSIRKAKITIGILAIGLACIVSMCCYTGLVIYATFFVCDPISTKQIGKADQLLPHFVMAISKGIPGLPGLFMAGVFSAALSSMSTGLNSMTGIIFEDLIRPCVKKPISEARASFIMKVMVALIGALCVALVFLVEKLGTLLQAGRSLSSITAGPLLGVFSLGLLFPWANGKGALVGGITSMLLVGWISVGSQTAIAGGTLYFETKPTSIAGCPEMPTVAPASLPRSEAFVLYQLSYMWYTLVGCATALFVGIITSFITGATRVADVDRAFLSPAVHWLLPSQKEGAEMEMPKRKDP